MAKNKKSTCPTCGGKGFVLVAEKPGAMPTKRVACDDPWHKNHFTEDEELDLLLEETKVLQLDKVIPNRMYREQDFDLDQLKKTMTIPRNIWSNDKNFAVYLKTLNHILEAAKRKGELPKNSYFIQNVDGTGKKFFAYTLMKILADEGFSIGPIKNVSDYFEDIMDNRFKDYQFTKEHFLADGTKVKEPVYVQGVNGWIDSCDIVFLNLEVGVKATSKVYVLDYVLERCALLGKPLIVLSRTDSVGLFNAYGSSDFNWIKSDYIRGNVVEFDYSHLIPVEVGSAFSGRLGNYRKKFYKEDNKKYLEKNQQNLDSSDVDQEALSEEDSWIGEAAIKDEAMVNKGKFKPQEASQEDEEYPFIDTTDKGLDSL